MKTLRELRMQSGQTQADLARKIKTNTPIISNYEAGQTPPLEDMVALERSFDQHIFWHESMNVAEKREIIQAIVTLMELYPINSVLYFAQRCLKEGSRYGNQSAKISYYAEVTNLISQEPLLPTQFNRNKRQ